MRKYTNLFYIIATYIILTGLLLFSGCENSSSKANAQNGKSEEVRDEVIIAVHSEPEEGFDPLLGWGGYGNPFFQSTLLKRDRDFHIVPDLAESYSLSDDGRVWKIKIRSDAKFTDGKPLTARDVAFTFNQAARAGGKIDMTVLEQAIAFGDDEVEIHLKKPRITFLYRLITIGIVPEHAYDENYARHPIGSGPYKFVRWDEGRQMIMEANENYYGDKPQIRRVVFLFMAEDTAFAAAKAGKIHVVKVPQILAKQKINMMKRYVVPSVDNRGICFPYEPDIGRLSPEGYPVGNTVTSDIAIRKAVNYAINRQELVDGILEGFGSPAYGPVSTLAWDQPDAVIQDGDLEKAREILADNGWKDRDGDGIVEKNNIKAEFILLYPSDDLIRQTLALSVADMIQDAGIHAIVTGETWENIYKRMHKDAVLFGFGSFDQSEMHNLYHSKREIAHYYNAGFYHNETVDAYFEQAMQAASESEAILFWQKAQWDGNTGFSAKGDAAWAWLVNLHHTYFADEHLDMGQLHVEQHGSYITANLPAWRWIR